MFYDTTFDDRDRVKEINQILGKPFGIFEILKKGGVGSSRMFVDNVSPHFQKVLNAISNVNYSSIELRPKGIIIHFVQQGLKSWCWLVPYHQLVTFHSDGLRIDANGKFVSFRNDKNLKSNYKFIQKILKEKNDYLQL